MPALTLPSAPESKRLNLRFLEPIWHIKGHVPLEPGQSRDEAFAKLSPLFFERGTSHHRSGDTLEFSKKDPAAQDKMAVFNSGVLEITEGGPASGGVLHYRLASNALLYCFLAPALFLSFAGLTIAAGKLDPPKEPTAAEKAKEEKKKAEPLPQHWIDKMLGAPVPEKPGSDKAETKAKAGTKDGKDAKDKKKEDKRHSPTPAYVFAGLFATLYVVGRVLEDRLVKRLFRRKLREA
jgi:hypothetical protein